MAEITLLDVAPSPPKIVVGDLIWRIDYESLDLAFVFIGDTQALNDMAGVGVEVIAGAVDGDWPVITESETVLIYNVRNQVGRPLPDFDRIVPELGYALCTEVLTPNYITAWYNDRSDGEDWLISKNANGYTVWTI